MHPFDEAIVTETRRQFFGSAARGLGLAALASLLDKGQLLGEVLKTPMGGSLAGLPHFPPKARRAIYLHMVGAPPQMDLFDYKPGLKDWFDKDLPDSIRRGQRLTTMTSGQTRFPIAPSVFNFQTGKAAGRGTWSCSHTRQKWWMIFLSFVQCTRKRLTTSPPSPSCRRAT